MNINFSGKYILQCSRAEEAARVACQKMQALNSNVQEEIDTITENQSEVNRLQTDIFEKQQELDKLSEQPFQTLETPQQITDLYADISEKQKEINKKQIEIQQKQLNIMKLRNFAFILNGKELSEGKDKGRGAGANLVTNMIVSNGEAKINSGLDYFDASDYFALREGIAAAYKNSGDERKNLMLRALDIVFKKPKDYQGNKVLDLTSWESRLNK